MYPVHFVTAGNCPMALIPTTYGTAYAMPMGQYPLVDPSSQPFPATGTTLGFLEISCSTVVGAANIQPMLTWDAAGDYIIWQGTALALLGGVTTAATKSSIVDVSRTVCPNPNSVSGKVYLWLKTNAGTVTCTAARLYFQDVAL